MNTISESGYANPSCYARKLENCVSKISGEHFISKKILKRIEKKSDSGRLIIQGPSWLPKDTEKKISANTMQANILCTKHNSDLSGIDAVGVDFCNYLLDLKINKKDLGIDARLVEKWFLKILCGFVSSGFLRGFNGWSPSRKWLDILFLDKDFPDGSGLYYLASDKRLEATDSEFGIWPVTNDDLTNVIGVHLSLSGYTFIFLMSEMTDSLLEKHSTNGFRPIYRPSIIQIEYNSLVQRLILNKNDGEIVDLKITSRKQV